MGANHVHTLFSLLKGLYMPNYVVIDVETGGIDPQKHSILEIAGVLWTPGSGTKEIFSTYIKENQIMAVDEALKINKIDLDTVLCDGRTPEDTIVYIKQRLDLFFGKKRTPCVLVAHNAHFDYGFTKRLYELANEDIKKDFSRRTLDTAGILQWLMITNKLPLHHPTSDFLFEQTNVYVPDNLRHTALGDAKATADALEVLYRKNR